MEQKQFLNKLKDVKIDGIKIFEEYPIKDLEKSKCSKTSVMMFDFDKVKDKVAKKYKIKSPSSCDGLKFDNYQSVDFIELKSIVDIFKYPQKPKISSVEDFENKIKSFKFEKYIIDSNKLIESLLDNSSNDFSILDKQIYSELKKNYFIVFDIDLFNPSILTPIQQIAFTTNKLAIENKLTLIVQSKVTNIDIVNFSGPFIKNCTTINEHYTN